MYMCMCLYVYVSVSVSVYVYVYRNDIYEMGKLYYILLMIYCVLVSVMECASVWLSGVDWNGMECSVWEWVEFMVAYSFGERIDR